MKYRQKFVSNSSSASFIVEIPSTDKDDLLERLYGELAELKKSLEESKNKCKEFSKKQKLKDKEDIKDLLTWEKSLQDSYLNDISFQNDKLIELENIELEKDLVLFGLKYYGILFRPIFSKKEDCYDSSYSFDEKNKEIIGYELCDFVNMFNTFSDIPPVLRDLTGALSFMYSNLHCRVEED